MRKYISIKKKKHLLIKRSVLFSYNLKCFEFFPAKNQFILLKLIKFVSKQINQVRILSQSLICILHKVTNLYVIKFFEINTVKKYNS